MPTSRSSTPASAYHPDLNVAGGYNCSTADPTAWRDKNDHGTHVAGTVAALDNGFGVVGVAPGARVWGVKILNDDGYGLISWYVCGLDWILAQRDPNDASRPLFEAVNMSVTKSGSDDRNCGFTNNDPLHQAICRVVAGGITVVAAAANDHHNAAKNIPASYNEVITVSALADTDGKPGGLGGNACYSWGGYDKDDTFADFSNYGADVDIMAPGKCILSTVPGRLRDLSGTSMAAPTVTGAVALYKASRPNATPAEVREALRYLGNLNWTTSTDPDPYHEPLLDVSRIRDARHVRLRARPRRQPRPRPARPRRSRSTLARSATFFERVRLSITSLPDGWTGGPSPSSLMGWTANTRRLSVTIPPARRSGGTRSPSRPRTRAGRRRRPSRSTSSRTIRPPRRRCARFAPGIDDGLTRSAVRVVWPAGDRPVERDRRVRDADPARTAAPGAPSTCDIGARRRAIVASASTSRTGSACGRSTRPATGARGSRAPARRRVHPVDDRSSSIGRSGPWSRTSSSSAYRVRR